MEAEAVCGVAGKAIVCDTGFPYGHELSSLRCFWSSDLQMSWERQCKMIQVLGPLPYMWDILSLPLFLSISSLTLSSSLSLSVALSK